MVTLLFYHKPQYCKNKQTNKQIPYFPVFIKKKRTDLDLCSRFFILWKGTNLKVQQGLAQDHKSLEKDGWLALRHAPFYYYTFVSWLKGFSRPQSQFGWSQYGLPPISLKSPVSPCLCDHSHCHRKIKSLQAWWDYTCNPTTGRTEEGRCKVQGHPGYIVRTCLKMNK
jgi:hypothetical protein